MNIYEKIAENLYRPFHRIDIINQNKILIDSPTIFIVNHQSVSEPLVIYRAIKNYCGVNARFLAMSELFKTPIIKKFMVGLNFIPVYRKTSRAKDSLTDAINFLNGGENPVLALYPEGELSKDRSDLNIRKFKTGAAKMALTNHNIKVIPIAQSGTAPGKIKVIVNILKRPKVKIKFGDPINIPSYLYGRDNSQSVPELTKIFEETVAKLYSEIK